MKRRLQQGSLFTLIFISVTLQGQDTFTSGGGTTWGSSGSWTCSGPTCLSRPLRYPGEPGYTNDIVNINSNIVLSNALTPQVDAITINDASLTIRGTTGIPTLTAASVTITSTAASADFLVFNNGFGSPTVAINGNVTINKNSNAAASTTRFRVGGDAANITTSVVTIGGNLTYNYSPTFTSSTEGSTEINVGASATNDNCRLIVTGNVNLNYSFNTSAAGNVLAFEVGHSSSASMMNLNAQIIESTGTGSGSDIRIATVDNLNASITINGNATLTWGDDTSANGGSNIYLNAGKSDPGSATSITILGSLNMISTTSTGGTINNTILASGTSQISLFGDLNFQASLPTGMQVENRIELSDNSVFDIKGAINNTGQGSFDFSPTGTASDNCTIIFSGNVQQNFPVRFKTATSYYKNITINNSSGLAFSIPNSTLQVEGNLTMTDGKINSTSANQFIFRATATSNQGTATSYITGPVKRLDGADIVLPLGGGTMWAPLGISNIVGGVGATFTAQYSSTPYSVLTTDGTFDHVSGLEYWDLSVSGATPTLDLTLFWKQACVSEIYDLTTGPLQDLFIGHYNGTNWNLVGGAYSLSGEACGVPSEMGSITAGVSLVSGASPNPYTFAAKAPLINPLPVVLSDFWAEVTNANVAHLKWITESEVNSDYYVIEKSVDGNMFYPIDSIAASGTTSEKHYYEIVDPFLVGGTNYYMLCQKDLDGTVNKYKIISVTIAGIKESISLYPVPVDAGQSLELAIRKDLKNESLIIKAYSIMGHEVTDVIEFRSAGLNRMYLSTDHLKPGTYILHTFTSSLSSINKFIVR